MSATNQETQLTLLDVEQRSKPCSTCGCYFPHCQFADCKPGIDTNVCNGHYVSCWLTSEGSVDPTYRPKWRSSDRELTDED